ncbi:outer membrane lipoprotein-sorting protein, partial [Thermodesulfobacteriota bacterium]
MPCVLALIVFMVAGLVPGQSCALAAEEHSPREILDWVDDLFRGKSSHGRMTMEIATRHWKRTLTMEFWTKGKEKSLVRILAPKKEKDTATLRSG